MEFKRAGGIAGWILEGTRKSRKSSTQKKTKAHLGSKGKKDHQKNGPTGLSFRWDLDGFSKGVVKEQTKMQED